MKKQIIVILTIIIQYNIARAMSPQNIDDIVNAFEKTEQSQEQRTQNLTSFNNILTIAYQKAQSHIKPIILVVQEEIQKRLDEKETVNQQYAFPLTTQKRLDLHNNVREKTVQIHPDLMRSAQIRAEYLSKNNIKSGTHKRDRSDTNSYNYNMIQQRFKNLDITFTNTDGWTFSENIAYNTVKCTTQNCDQELAKATEKSRTFFYDREKSYGGSHYRAIVQENFKYIGVGIAIDNGRYHIVIHYGTEIEKTLQLTQK